MTKALSDPSGRSGDDPPGGPTNDPADTPPALPIATEASSARERIPGPVLDQLVAFLERTSDLVGVTDDSGSIVYLNRAARQRLGLREDSVKPLSTADLFPDEAFDIYYDQIRPRIIAGDVWTGYLPVRGAVEPIQMWATVVGETQLGGEVSWMVLTARDINDWHHAPDGAQHHTAYDELTGLATRSLLMDHLAKAQTHASRTGQAVSVAFIDIDDMKALNHTFGQAVGDAVLFEVAHRLSDAVRVIDTVARVGGDQFVVLFDGVDGEEETDALVTQIQATVEASAVEVGNRSVNVSASIGTAVARDGELGDQLLGRADTAMYEVKADRRHQSGRPAPTIGPDLRSVTLKDLAVAVTRHEIVPFYQRVVDAVDGTTRGVQALARWLRPTGPPVDAAQFLTIADDSGVSFSLDLAILRDAAAAMARRVDLGRLYVPVSPRFLRRPGVDRFVHEVLTRADLAPDRLAILVPEQLVTTRALVIGDAIAALQDLGVHLVLDLRPTDDRSVDSARLGDEHHTEPRSSSHPGRDDPTGADGDRATDIGSAFDEIRLAPAWIRLLDDEPDAIGARVSDATGRGQRVLVGGVETDDQRRRLVELGCDLLSGHLIAAPAAAPD